MSTTTRQHREDLMLIAVCVCVVLLFLLRAPFGSSFWLDETLSVWATSDGLSDTWRRGWLFLGQGPLYYTMLWAWKWAFGSSEIALRMLSVFLCAGAVAVAGLLCRLLHLPILVVAMASAFVVASDVFQDALLSVRPYSLAIILACASLVCALRLRDAFSVKRAVAFLISMVLAFYSHYLFAPLIVPHLFALRRHVRNLAGMWLWIVAAGVVCIPGLLHIVILHSRVAGVELAASLTGLVVLKGLVPITSCIAAVVGSLLALVWDGRVSLDKPRRNALQFLLPYVLWAPIPFLCLSLCGFTSLWTPRYWSWQIIPLGLVVAVLITSFAGRRAYLLATGVTAIFLLLRIATQERVVEGWREAARLVAAHPGPVLLYSGLAEAESSVVNSLFERDLYLRTVLQVYGVRNEIRLVGLAESDESIAAKMRGVSTFVAQQRMVVTHSVSHETCMGLPERFQQVADRFGLKLVEEEVSGTVAVFSMQ